MHMKKPRRLKKPRTFKGKVTRMTVRPKLVTAADVLKEHDAKQARLREQSDARFIRESVTSRTSGVVAHFEIYRSKDGHRWRLRAKNGRIVADSGEAYVKRSNAIRSVQGFRKLVMGAITKLI
jgi:uncharacterized protein YegP (UPF0339 family)